MGEVFKKGGGGCLKYAVTNINVHESAPLECESTAGVEPCSVLHVACTTCLVWLPPCLKGIGILPQLGDVLSAVCEELSQLPRYLIPCYFEAVVTLVHGLLTSSAIAQMGRYGKIIYVIAKFSTYAINISACVILTSVTCIACGQLVVYSQSADLFRRAHPL